MRKFLLSLIAIVTICANAWGDGSPWTCGNVIVTLNESTKTLTLSPVENSDGVMENLTEAETKWRSSTYRSNVKTIIIEDGVSYIGAYAFYYCLYITSIKIPKSVTNFATKAFLSTNSARTIYYEGTPNEWANITFTDGYSHPFYSHGDYTTKFYFNNQTSTETTNIILTAGITTIKPYAFYNATNIVDVYIPGTVTSIQQHAFDCKIRRLYINKSVAPSTETSAITWTTSSDTYLYLRSDATNSYNTTPWYHSGSANSDGAKYLGYNYDHASIRVDCLWKSGRSLYNVSGTEGSITWTLSENGTLSLNGTGAMPRTYTATNDDENVLPWYRFRYLINKIVIQGGITGLTSALSWAYEMTEIDINQNSIPSSTTSTDNIENNYHVGNNIALKVKSAALASGDDLGSTPWTSTKFTTILSDDVTIDQDADNTTLLSNIHNYVDEPFDLQITRSLTNAQYNTFCSPVPMSASDISSKLRGADIRKLKSSGLDGDELTLTFSDPLDAIEAGKPYLIQPTDAVENLTFTNIDPSDIVTSSIDTTTTYVDFIGVLAPTLLTGGNKNTLFLGADNELFWPEADGNIKGMRAYFSLKGAAQQAAKRARIVMNKEVATDIESISDERLTISGKKILRNGQLFIIRDGKEYNVMGIMMK